MNANSSIFYILFFVLSRNHAACLYCSLGNTYNCSGTWCYSERISPQNISIGCATAQPYLNMGESCFVTYNQTVCQCKGSDFCTNETLPYVKPLTVQCCTDPSCLYLR